MKQSYQAAWCIGAILTAAAPKADAVTTIVTNDASDLAAAFAPVPGDATVTGNFVEVSTGADQIGSFTNGGGSIGFGSGIILSTGNVADISVGAGPALSTGYGGTTSVSTSSLLSQIPSLGANFSDAARISLTINPGLVSSFVNFSFAYLTSEISPSDMFGIFVNGVYAGNINGNTIDQGNPWINASSPDLGFTQALYLDGNPVNPLFFTMSIEVPSPGADFDLDFVIADVFGDEVDTAVLLGEFSATTSAAGVVIPEPSTTALVALAGLAWVRRRKRS